jgi:osmotically inducible protein OsmC
MAEPVYTAEATSSGGGRDGRVRTSDGVLDVELKLPPALGGPGGATNPEQLFAAAYASCFHGALRLVARNKGVRISDDATVDAAVDLSKDATGFAIGATLTVHLPGLDQPQADDLVAAAHEVCPYSKATRGNVEVELKATV